MHYDGSSCNGCDIEVLACLTPVYDVERFGIINTGNPKHADILLITGSVNEQNKNIIQNIYHQMPDPKAVVAIGICASSGGIFRECYNVLGGVGHVIPVDVYVPGCAARPESIIDGVVKALGVLEEKSAKIRDIQSGREVLHVEKASIEDAELILHLQKEAYQSEAEIYGNFDIAPLRQTLAELKTDFDSKYFLKASYGNEIVGSVRAYSDGGTCHIGRLIVAPARQSMGIGTRLMNEIEAHFADASRYELFTGHKSRRNLFFYKKRGYSEFRHDIISDSITRVFLEKTKENKK